MTKLSDIFQNPSNPSAYIVSEIGINHDGSLEKALQLIDASKLAGVDAVKFQKRKLENIYSKSILEDANSAEWSFDYLIPLLKEVELSESDYHVIKKHCDKVNLDLIITPFDLESAEFAASLDVAAFKIASADMVSFELIEKCASYKKPLIISTGMWDEDTIQLCSEKFKQDKIDFCLLLANSTYPSPYEAINLGFMKRLKELAPVVGYSGHERGTHIPVAAFALGARIIEKHITFDRTSTGPDHKASMLPDEWNQMVSQLRDSELAFGDKKEVNQAETLAKEAFAKSAVAVRNLSEGHILQKEDIIFRSPGKGIFPHEIIPFFGKAITRDIAEGFYIAKSDFDEIIPLSKWPKFHFSKKWGVKCRFHDFEEYGKLESPVVEFHCSETDLGIDFKGGSKVSELVVHAPEIMGRELVDICSRDKRVVESSIGLLQQSIDKTLRIAQNFPVAKPKLVMHLGGMSLDMLSESDPNSEMIGRAIESFKKLQYSPDDIQILPENLPPRPWYLGGQWHQYGFMPPEDLVRFCEYFELGMTFDICHAGLYCNYEKTSLSEYAKTVSHLVKHMHISDARGIDGEGIQVGEGNINFDKVLSHLKDSDTSWVTEIWSGHLHQGAGCRHSLHKLGKYNHLI